MKKCTPIVSLFVLYLGQTSCCALADSFDISQPSGIFINGLSYHFKDLNQQSVNLGAGVYYKFKNDMELLGVFDAKKMAIEFDAYDDSYGDFGYAAGVSWKANLINNLFIGFKTGLVHEDNASKSSGLYLIPYAVPFLEFRRGAFGIRSMLVPPLGKITNGYVTLQLSVDLPE